MPKDEPPPDAQIVELPWLDRPDALAAIANRLQSAEITEDQADWLRKWVRDGYVTIEGLLERERVEAINAEIDALYESNKHLPLGELKPKFVNLFVSLEAIREVLVLPEVIEPLDLLLGRRMHPFQTLNFPISSQLGVHSDQIHFSTNPRGFAIAIWFALEDIQPDRGPLVVFPGSHRLDYIGPGEVGIPDGAPEGERGELFDRRYYTKITDLVHRHGLDYDTYLPKCGDALIWHSNLLHGAKPVSRRDGTRRSMVVHYFAEDSQPHSDLWQRPCALPDLARP